MFDLLDIKLNPQQNNENRALLALSLVKKVIAQLMFINWPKSFGLLMRSKPFSTEQRQTTNKSDRHLNDKTNQL
jgi:hypothetical protein